MLVIMKRVDQTRQWFTTQNLTNPQVIATNGNIPKCIWIVYLGNWAYSYCSLNPIYQSLGEFSVCIAFRYQPILRKLMNLY